MLAFCKTVAQKFLTKPHIRAKMRVTEYRSRFGSGICFPDQGEVR